VLGILLLRTVKNRIAYIAGAAMLGLVALPFLPASYWERMATITEHGGDQSASTRVAVWEWTIDYVSEHPFGGGFDAYRGNSFKYIMPERKDEGSSVSIEYVEVEDKGRAFHSSYFELLGEQGYPGFIVWMMLQLTGLWQMERLRRRYRSRDGPEDAWIGPLAAGLQNAHVVYLVGAAFQGIGYQPVIYLFLGLQIALWTYCAKRESLAPDEGSQQRRSRREKRAARNPSSAPVRETAMP